MRILDELEADKNKLKHLLIKKDNYLSMLTDISRQMDDLANDLELRIDMLRMGE